MAPRSSSPNGAGRANRTLLFYNHYDVQPPEPLELWTSPPFQPEIRDGKLFARGASDDKGHIICRLAAIDAFLEVDGELPCNVKFVIEGEEETASTHLHEFILDHLDLLKSDACIWEFGGVDHEGIPIQYAGLRGICYVELSVRTATQDAHSGLGGSIFPNAAWRLTWALNSLKGPDERIRIPGFYDRVLPPTAHELELLSKLPDPAERYKANTAWMGLSRGLKGGLELEREAIFSPTCTICGISSGYEGPGTKTVQPSTAMAKVDFRLVPNQDPEEILLLLRNHLDEQGFRGCGDHLPGRRTAGSHEAGRSLPAAGGRSGARGLRPAAADRALLRRFRSQPSLHPRLEPARGHGRRRVSRGERPRAGRAPGDRELRPGHASYGAHLEGLRRGGCLMPFHVSAIIRSFGA